MFNNDQQDHLKLLENTCRIFGQWTLARERLVFHAVLYCSKMDFPFEKNTTFDKNGILHLNRTDFCPESMLSANVDLRLPKHVITLICS